MAEDYLRATVLVLLGWAWRKIEAVASTAADPSRWDMPASALRQWVLPEFEMRLGIIRARLR